ncbi:NAD(P)H-binding protein [Actinoplanes sp. URMC 104]|uniref:NAD(P)H-binding protein n=1 Tax=Actinoplanes sp. URMC 104 TaxID=3423409 RepID=UPI003F1DA01F
MTTVGVTKHTPGRDWKRRGERLVRASGLPYTIVRPGWFDYHAPGRLRLVMKQGDRNWAGDPSDGVVSRRQIAEVLVASLTSAAAAGKTFELAAQQGPPTSDLDPLFDGLQPDQPDSLDAVLDVDNMPLDAEPATVREQLTDIRNRRRRRPRPWMVKPVLGDPAGTPSRRNSLKQEH